MLKPKLSIIVPVYKVEKYLGKCLDSILNQTFNDYELILVDDGSTDGSGKICDKYAIKDQRIKVIHKENGGLSSARNAGIDIAQGEYIAFVDSDDYINKNMYDILYKSAIENDADIIICKFKKVLEDEFIEEKDSIEVSKISTFNNINALEQIYTKNGVEFVVAWNKLYKREIFKGLRYKIGKLHEDEFIIHEIIYKANKVVYINEELYYYLQREESIMGLEFNIKRLDALEALRERMKFYREKKLKDSEYRTQESYINLFFKYYYKVKFNLNNSKPNLNKIRRDFTKSLIYIIKNPYYNWKEKCMWILFCINPKIHERYCNNEICLED